MAKALNLGVTAWSPLSNGVLTVKYHGHGFSESGRMSSDMLKEFMPEEQKTARMVTAVKTVADQAGRSMAQVGLEWLRARRVPIIPIIGARELSELQDNLGSFDFSLSADQVKALDEASQIDLRIPYDLYAKEAVCAADYRLGIARVSQLLSSYALRANFIYRELGAFDSAATAPTKFSASFAKSLAATCHVTFWRAGDTAGRRICCAGG